jgi:hypothetical protein
MMHKAQAPDDLPQDVFFQKGLDCGGMLVHSVRSRRGREAPGAAGFFDK